MTEKGLFSFQSQTKVNAKECSNYHTIALISHASKVMLKILQARLQQYVSPELPDVQAGIFIFHLFHHMTLTVGFKKIESKKYLVHRAHGSERSCIMGTSDPIN